MKTLVTALFATSFLFLSSFALAQYENKPMEPANSSAPTTTLTVENLKFLVLPSNISSFQGDLNVLTGKTLMFEGKPLVIETAKWSQDCKITLTFQQQDTTDSTTEPPEDTFDGIKDSAGKVFPCSQSNPSQPNPTTTPTTTPNPEPSQE